jgi:hypothetical protein
MGRTFIEQLDLIPILEAELECSLSAFIGRAAGASVASPGQLGDIGDIGPTQMGIAAQQKLATRLGPLKPVFNIAAPGEGGGKEEEYGEYMVAAPLVKPNALLKPISTLKAREIIRHVLIPGDWVSRASVVAAVRMGDSALMPMIPLGAIVAIDMRPTPPEKMLGRIAAIGYAGRGFRIRRVVRNMEGDRFFGASIIEHARAQMPILEERGDRILGRVIGIFAAVE